MEQPLPPNGSCLLGSVDLTKFVVNPFTKAASFDYDKYTEVIKIFTRMLDNVVDIHGLPLAEQEHEIITKRRHGMGYLGLGSTMTMLGIDYDSIEAIDFTDEVSKLLTKHNWITSAELAEEKGTAPIFKNADIYNDWLYSEYMLRIAHELPNVWKLLAEKGSRFTHATSIAPTGTLALTFGNNCSNGIEPSFAHSYKRNIIIEGKKSKQQMEVVSKELYEYRKFINNPEAVAPTHWKSAEDISPKSHVDIQAAAQYWIDSSISKTINVATDYDFDKFKDIYMYAYEKGLKGCTTFRFNPEAFSGVLVQDKELGATTYVFKLANGESVEAKGNDTITYEGEQHTASNLYDALKEGYYGKF